MSEAEEVERGAPRSRVLGALRPLEAEVDEARLVGMEREPIPGKTLAQNSQDPRGIGKGLESHHEIVGVPDKAGSSLQAWSDRVFEPHIQHMVQVDVRNTRGDHPSLWCPFGWTVQASLLQDARLQPFVDHPSNDPVRDSLVEEVPQMAVGDRVEVTLNVDIDTPPHTGAHAGGAQSVERLVSRAAGPEAIRAGEE